MRFRWILIVTLQVFLLSTPAYAGETWKIASLNWEPYSSAEMVTQGTSIQKLRMLLKKADIDLIVEFYPWLRAKKIARNSDFMGYFPAWPEEVGEGFIPSPPIDWSWISVLKRSGVTLEYNDLDELFSRYKIGLVGTYTYPNTIKDRAERNPNNIIYAPNEVSLLRMLSAGRYDVGITDPHVMTYLSDKEGADAIETEKTLMKKALVIAIRNNKKNKERLELLQTLLKTEI